MLWKSSASASSRASSSRPLSIRASAAPARHAGDAVRFAGELHDLLDELPSAALEVANRVNSCAPNIIEGVGLAGCRADLERLRSPTAQHA